MTDAILPGAKPSFLRQVKRRWRDSVRRRRRAHAARRRTRSRNVYVLTVSLLILLASFGWALYYLSAPAPGQRLTQGALTSLIKEHRIELAVFADEDAQIVGRYAAQPLDRAGAIAVRPDSVKGAGEFHFPYPKSDALTGQLNEQLVDSGARVTIDKQQSKANVRVVATFLLPFVILANLFTLLFSLSRGAGSGIGEVMTFGTLGKDGKRRKRHGRDANAVSFDDVAGAEEAVAELREVRDYLADPERYEELGAQPPKGVLLFGPPGCGKTLLAKAVAGEAGVPFFSVAGAEFVESLVGVGAARVRDLFKRVRAVAPAIVFIDELDAAGRKRGTAGGAGGSDEREQTLNQLLVEMDGFDVSSGIVVMAATNRPDIIDPALMRPGRFDRHITVDQPDIVGRRKILELHARGKPVSPAVDFGYLARRTPGFTGADLANVLNEAALLTVREGKSQIETAVLEEAVQRVLAGPKRRGRVLSAEERKRASYHESGHAIATAASGGPGEVHRVSILARGGALGGAGILREGDAALETFSMLRARLISAMGGIAAEELAFGEPSTGAEEDLEQATQLARDMVGRYGMSAKIGRSRLLAHVTDAFLGGDAHLAPISGQTHQDMDHEIRRLLDEAESEALRLLTQHRTVLDQLAATLETEETLEGPALDAMLLQVRPQVELFTSTARNGGVRGRATSRAR
ncbi:MAG: ATP-dependent zinc metalloprotease FtsH [Frankia sp.]|nr:ATP-dependent zinc metalloprotease FtsH [Frankia sp.]